jgi:hypothetical protein
MFLQGDLQALFDALYSVGAIDPVLKMDWQQVNQEMVKNQNLSNHAFKLVNECRGDTKSLIEKLHSLDQKSLSFLAVEVAREFAEFQERKALH